MADFGSVINAYIAGKRPKFSPLVELKFRDGVKRYWQGGYSLTTTGKVWESTRDLVAIDGIDLNPQIANDAMTLTFSMAKESGAGSDMWQMSHSSDVGQYRRRPAILYLAFFDADWQLLAEPYAFKAGMMMAMPFDDKRNGDGRLEQVHIKATSIHCWRSTSHADPYYSDRSQQTKYPGDRGLQFLQSIQRVQFPVPWR